MDTAVHPHVTSDLAFEDRVLRKAFRRIVVFVFIICVFEFLDRSIGFAALTMNKDLKLTATMFGVASSLFALGYVIFEIPSNMLLARFGARKWIARIVFTWGLCTIGMAFVTGAHGLYGLRLFQGLSEAGFLPGIFLFLTYWFPPSFRGRATAFFATAQPVTFAIGAPFAGLVLDSHGLLGLTGWRLLFLVEGLPTVVLAIITYFYLSDGPDQARWLSDSEKAALKRRLQREEATTGAHSALRKVWREIFSPVPLLLSLAYFAIVTGMSTGGYWTPQILREVVQHRSFSYVGLLTAIPFACTIVAMPLWGAHSDRKMERTWHAIAPLLLSVLGWLVVAFANMPESRLLGLTCAIVGVYMAQTIFWTMSPHLLSPAARPAGLAFISTIGALGSMTAPTIVGFLKDLTHTFTASLLYVAAVLAICAVAVLLVRADERTPAAISDPSNAGN